MITGSLYLQNCVCDTCICGGGGMLEMSDVSCAEWKKEKKKKEKKKMFTC